MTDYLSVDDLYFIATRTLAPAQPLMRDAGALVAAAERPKTTVFGQDAYPTLPTKAAALLHSITRNHPLVDGNKRLGWVATAAFCAMNGYDLDWPDDDAAEQFVLAVATGDLDVDKASEVIADHLVEREPPAGDQD